MFPYKVVESKLIEFVNPSRDQMISIKVELIEMDCDGDIEQSLHFLDNYGEFVGSWDRDMGGGLCEEIVDCLDDDEKGYVEVEQIMFNILHPKFPGFFSDYLVKYMT